MNALWRRRLLVSCANQPSMRFSHDELVGEVQMPPALLGRLGEPVGDGRSRVRGEVVQHDVDSEVPRGGPPPPRVGWAGDRHFAKPGPRCTRALPPVGFIPAAIGPRL